MSIYSETMEVLGFDPAAPGPDTSFDEWVDVIPDASLSELIDKLTVEGGLDITREWRLFEADYTMRQIVGRDATETFPKVDADG